MEKILPDGLIAATEQLLIASGAASEATVNWARSQAMVAVYEAFDWMLPGQFEAFGHRKAFCELQVREAIEGGACQVLVLGAGYDTLCWRLAPEFSGRVRFFEIDHPATAICKARGINLMGQHENLYLFAEDLGRQKISEILSATTSWDETAQTVIIAEGLVMYLQEEAVEDLFCQCARVTGKRSRIVFSYFPKDADGRPYVGSWSNLMLWLQRVGGEPWLSSIAPTELDGFLKKTGWNMVTDEQYSRYGVEYYAVAAR